MKNSIIIFVLSLMIQSCASRIGTFTIISTRNIETGKKYEEISRYKNGNGKTIENAIENCIKKEKGGEYVVNCKIYRRNGIIRVLFSGRYKVQGDIWGIKQD